MTCSSGIIVNGIEVPGKQTVVSQDGNAVDINDSGQMHVVLRGNKDANNSTVATLGGGATFTGTSSDILDYGFVFVSVYSDVASATDGLSLEQSCDGTNWDHTDTYTIGAATPEIYSIQPGTCYFRVRYTNGATPQGVFRLQTVFKKTSSLPSSHRIGSSISKEDDAQLVMSVITAEKDGDGFDHIHSTKSGNLKVANVENGLAIAAGDVVGVSFIHKFGNAPDFDTGDGEVTIWGGADDAHINQMQYQYSTSADIDSLVSDDATDTQDYTVVGLDTNWDEVTQTVTANGQTRVALGTSLIRVTRVLNAGTTDNAGHVYTYVNSSITGGTPDDPTKVRSVIQPGDNQTLMAIYSIPNGKTGYMRDWYAALAGASKSSNYVIDVRIRPFGGVFQLKHRSALAEAGSSHLQHRYEEPEIVETKSDIEIRANATAVGTTQASVSAGFDIVLIDD